MQPLFFSVVFTRLRYNRIEADMINQTTVYLIDDDADLSELVALQIRAAGYPVVTYPSAEAYLADNEHSRCGCLLLDIFLPGLNGLELQQALNQRGDEIPVIMITSRGDINTAVQAMKNGAIDYIEKPLDFERLLERIHECLILDASQRNKAERQEKYGRYLESLTAREHEVIELLVAGQMNKSIAIELGISQRTVEDHRARIMTKLHARSLADVVRIDLLSRY